MSLDNAAALAVGPAAGRAVGRSTHNDRAVADDADLFATMLNDQQDSAGLETTSETAGPAASSLPKTADSVRRQSSPGSDDPPVPTRTDDDTESDDPANTPTLVVVNLPMVPEAAPAVPEAAPAVPEAAVPEAAPVAWGTPRCGDPALDLPSANRPSTQAADSGSADAASRGAALHDGDAVGSQTNPPATLDSLRALDSARSEDAAQSPHVDSGPLDRPGSSSPFATELRLAAQLRDRLQSMQAGDRDEKFPTAEAGQRSPARDVLAALVRDSTPATSFSGDDDVPPRDGNNVATPIAVAPDSTGATIFSSSGKNLGDRNEGEAGAGAFRPQNPAGADHSIEFIRSLSAAHQAVDVVSSPSRVNRSFEGTARSGMLDDAGMAAQVVQAVRLQWRDGIGSARVTLDPEYLGEITVTLRVEGGMVTASVHAQNPDVRAWMEANQPLLRQGLSQQGLSLDQLSVSDEPPLDVPAREERRPPPRMPAKPSRRRTDPNTFEIFV